MAALIPALLERIRILEAVNASMKSTQKIQQDILTKYREENSQLKAKLGQTVDVFQLFVADSLVAETGGEVTISEARVAFKEWARFNPGHPATLTLKQFKERLAKLPGAEFSDDKLLKGYRLKELSEE